MNSLEALIALNARNLKKLILTGCALAQIKLDKIHWKTLKTLSVQEMRISHSSQALFSRAFHSVKKVELNLTLIPPQAEFSLSFPGVDCFHKAMVKFNCTTPIDKYCILLARTTSFRPQLNDYHEGLDLNPRFKAILGQKKQNNL